MRPFLKKTKRIYNKSPKKRRIVFPKSVTSKEDVLEYMEKSKTNFELRETYLNYQLFEV